MENVGLMLSITPKIVSYDLVKITVEIERTWTTESGSASDAGIQKVTARMSIWNTDATTHVIAAPAALRQPDRGELFIAITPQLENEQ